MSKKIKALTVNKRKGFTLVELLIVVAILAVLAVIAIPSVAGLIEKANVSADTTTVSEMSGALERFTVEYELYVSARQGGTVTADQDVAKTRVEAVLNAIATDAKAHAATSGAAGVAITPFPTGKSDVAALTDTEFREFNQVLTGIVKGTGNTSGTVDGNKALLDYKSKLPTTAKGFAAIIQNYTKLKGSTIFMPKQKQMSFYYNIDTAVVTFATAGKSACSDKELSAAISNNTPLSGAIVAETSKLDTAKARWIDVTATTYGAADLSKVANIVVGGWTAGSMDTTTGVTTATAIATGELFKTAPSST